MSDLQEVMEERDRLRSLWSDYHEWLRDHITRRDMSREQIEVLKEAQEYLYDAEKDISIAGPHFLEELTGG